MTTRTSAPLLWLALAASVAGCGDVTFPWSSRTPEAPNTLAVSAANLEFSAERDGPLPAAQSLTVTFDGDGLEGGFLGPAAPTWANAVVSGQGARSITITVTVTTTSLSPGTYDAVLVFVTADADGTDAVRRDVAVQYRVTRPLSASPTYLSFTTMEGSTAAPKSVTLTAERLPAAWSLSVEPVAGGPTDWLVLPAATGTMTSATAEVAVEAAQRPPGRYDATLVVRDEAGVTRARIAVSYWVVALRRISATPARLAFFASEASPAVPRTLTLSSEVLPTQWSLAVESAGAGPTDWLVLPAASGTLSTSTAEVQVEAAPRPAGTYAAVLVLRDGGGVERGRFPVTYTVDTIYSVAGQGTARITEAASQAELDRPLTLVTRLGTAAGADFRWAIASDAAWLTVTPASGDLAANTPLTVHLDAGQLWAMANGQHTAHLTVTFTSGGASASTVPFTLDLALQPALSPPAPVELAVGGNTGAAELGRTVAIASNLGEAFAAYAGFGVSSAAPWITATIDGATVALALQPDAIAGLPNGQHAATITLVPDEARVAGTSFQAGLDLRLPEVTNVAPYTTWVSREAKLIVRGAGFGIGGTVPVSVGVAPVQGTVVSDGELHVTVTAPAEAGRLAVTVGNALGLARPGGTLAVLPEPGYTAYAVPLAKRYSRMALDPERQAVLLSGGYEYAAGTYTDDIRRFRFVDGAWSEDAYPLAKATGAAITADGADLLVTAGMADFYNAQTVARLDPETLETRQVSTFSETYTQYDRIASLNDGQTMLINATSIPWTRWYPSLLRGPSLLDFRDPHILLTRDRGRIVVLAPYADGTFDVGDTVFRKRAEHGYSPLYSRKASQLSISADGGRLLDGAGVYDRDFSLLGSLVTPPAASWGVAVSPDGASAWWLGYETNAWVLRRADLRAATGPYTAEATAATIPLGPSESPFAMAVSEDGGTLFVLAASGDNLSKFVVVPLP